VIDHARCPSETEAGRIGVKHFGTPDQMGTQEFGKAKTENDETYAIWAQASGARPSQTFRPPTLPAKGWHSYMQISDIWNDRHVLRTIADLCGPLDVAVATWLEGFQPARTSSALGESWSDGEVGRLDAEAPAEGWLRAHLEDVPWSDRSEGSTAVVGDIDIFYIMIQPRIGEILLEDLGLQGAQLLTICKAITAYYSRLTLSLWAEGAIRRDWLSPESTTTPSTWTSAAFLQFRHESLKGNRAAADRDRRWDKLSSISSRSEGPKATPRPPQPLHAPPDAAEGPARDGVWWGGVEWGGVG